MGLYAVQLLDFNKDNTSESFFNNGIPTEDDLKLKDELDFKHEKFIKKREGPEFGLYYWGEWWDISRYIDPEIVSEDSFEKANEDCYLEKFYGCLILNKSNKESFQFIYDNVLCELDDIDFLDSNFNNLGYEDFWELILNKEKNYEPVVLHIIHYGNE